MSEPKLYIKARTNYNANPPASYKRDADYWENDMSDNLFYMSGNVGVGYPIPYGKFTVDGNVGIGTNVPLDALDVSGNSYFRGNIGIGSSAPSQQLDISGNINFTGNMYKNGELYEWVDATSTVSTRGAVYAWGYNTSPVPTTFRSNIIAISGGTAYSLALTNKGSVIGYSEYGYVTTVVRKIPFTALSNIIAISAGDTHALALNNKGCVLGWGDNTYGQTTIPASAQSGVIAIDAGYTHSLALKNDGTIIGWGSNSNGETTIPVDASSNVIAISTGTYFSLALRSDGYVVGWGWNNIGQTTIPLTAQSGVIAISAGDFHALALKSDGSVIAWGYNNSGQVSPIPSVALSNVIAISAGSVTSVALSSNGDIITWGDIQPPGNNYPYVSFSDGSSNAIAISAGFEHNLALRNIGNTYQTQYMYNTDSNIGIGTNMPLKLLHVAGDALVGSNINSVYYNYITPSSDGTVNGVNITAMNKRTRASDATVEATVTTWTSRTIGISDWNSICWSGERALFVMVKNGVIARSSNGITWTTISTPSANNNWVSVCWVSELSIFVTVSSDGSGNQIMTSTNGLAWTVRTNPINGEWRSVCWSPELMLLVAVGGNAVGSGIVMTSNDGITWISQTTVTSCGWGAVCWAPEKALFVAVALYASGYERAMTSPDGINWTVRTTTDDISVWSNICWSPELLLFVACGNGATYVMTSPDGINWTQQTKSYKLRCICWSPELSVFVGIQSSGWEYTTSRDGVNWILGTTIGGFPNCICWSPELSIFVSAGVGVSTSGIGMPNSKNVVKALPSQMTVNVNGNVGIGKTNPLSALDVSGNIYMNDGTAAAPVLTFSSDTNTGFYRAGADALGIVTGGTERVRVDASGNVGIGTSAPSQRLDVSGNSYFRGNIGVGKTPAVQLDVSGNIYMSDGTAAAPVLTFSSDPNTGFYRAGADALGLVTGGTERVRVDATGNVGIGVTNPQYKLDVQGGARITGSTLNVNSQSVGTSLYLESSAASTELYFNRSGVVSNFEFGTPFAATQNTFAYVNRTSGTPIETASFFIQPNGNVGIGRKTVGAQLDLSSDSARKASTTTWATGSDARVKQDIEDADTSLCYNIVKQVKLKRFAWDPKYYPNVDDRHMLGWIAQDVRQFFPNAVKLSAEYGFDDFHTLNSDQLYKVLYGAVHEIIQENTQLKEQIQQQQADIQMLKTHLGL